MECSICLEKIDHKDIEVLSCKHIFHSECVLKCKKISINSVHIKCPECREKVKLIVDTSLDFERIQKQLYAANRMLAINKMFKTSIEIIDISNGTPLKHIKHYN